jgi:hypothetical protein
MRGRDAPAKVQVPQQEQFRQLQGLFTQEFQEQFKLFIQVAEALVLLERPVRGELPQPVIRIEQVFVHAQQVRGANGIEARRERLRHQGAEGQEPRRLERSQLLAQPEA